MNDRQKTMQDLDDLLGELDVGNTSRPPSTAVKANKASEFDELEALVAQFSEEPKKEEESTTKARPPSGSKPPPPKVAKPQELVKEKTVVVEEAPKSTSGSGPVCGGCGNSIGAQHILAMSKMWHPDCLKCAECSAKLSGDFFEHNGQHVCKNCMEKNVRCTKCNEPITGEYLLGDGNKFHPGCIDSFYCAKCNESVDATQRRITAMGKHFHSSCFVCTGCSTALTGTFFNKGGSPYCESCGKNAQGSCNACSQQIVGGTPFIRYDTKQFHENCFRCTGCKEILNPSQFYNVNNLPHCQNCASKAT